ncbi:MAG: phosphatidylglycerophosphatase A [Acidimicrobiia bacterium]|nr:phosphatidylglycerophosphatase A [Acidimicrobiia bacterium]
MHRTIASWFGSGLLLGKLRGDHSGSGTVGSAVALGMTLLIAPYGWQWQALAAAVATGLSLWSSRPFAADGADPGWIVADEAAGMFLASIGLTVPAVLVAFVVFRVADATKKFPGVAAAERLHGALGITADDLVAGLWALAAGWALQLWVF